LKRIRIALIGCGGFGKLHAEALATGLDGKVELAWCVAEHEANARKFAELYGGRPATDYRAILDDVDAVDIVTPPHLHARMAIEAASRGKHVLTEKVMATNLADADAMIAAAQSSGVKLMVAYVMRFHRVWAEMESLVKTSVIGSPYAITCRAELFIEQPRPWYASGQMFPMGALLSHGCHYVDAMIWLAGQVEEAACFSRNVFHQGSIYRDDFGVAIFRFESGVLGQFLCSWATRHREAGLVFQINGGDGLLSLRHENDGAMSLVLTRKGADPQTLLALPPGNKSSAEAVAAECEHFAACILQDKTPLTNGGESRKSLAALLAAYEGEDGPTSARPG
jgi:predicted dehydrogenase